MTETSTDSFWYSEYMEKFAESSQWSASGYIGYEEGGELFQKSSQSSLLVLLFDEVEKAHPIFQCASQVLTDGGADRY